MGAKYLGMPFDIHGGGMDLLFPHHESEIAQSVAATGKDPVKYWLHNNMVTLNGQKMGKSLNNAISLDDFFVGNHPLLEQPYSPMTIRFFMLQAHYRSTLDFSNEALKAAEKGLKRLFQGIDTLNKLIPSDKSTVDIHDLQQKCYTAMDDDFNSPIVIAHLFDGIRIINLVGDKKEQLTKNDLDLLKQIFNDFVVDILGLKEGTQLGHNELINRLMDTILAIRELARQKKDFTLSDMIRKDLAKMKITVKDTKEGPVWEVEY
jgi:cysteinyl-tRNA synthetase